MTFKKHWYSTLCLVLVAIIIVYDKIRRLMAKQLDYTKINPRKLKRAGIAINHTFMVSQLERLASLLADGVGEVNVSCRFEWTETEAILMHLSIEGPLNVSCKSCLDTFTVKWSSKTTLALDNEDIINDDSSDELYEHVLMSFDGSINLIDVIIDEIILGLPERHPDECERDAAQSAYFA